MKAGEYPSLSELEEASEQASRPEAVPQTAAEQRAKPAPIRWIIPYVIGCAILLAGFYLIDWLPWKMEPGMDVKVRRYVLGAVAVIGILGVARGVEVYVVERLRNPVSRFNLRRIVRLGTGLVLVFVIISILFVNWYAAVVSLGLISLILGFALQTPISSFVAWVYILVRAPYRVGDRIEIGDARGDVIDVSYLDTTIWEIGGRHLTTDHPSGRIIRFPNTNVFTSAVINYSWPMFPYIWNEICFDVAYESDLGFIAETMEKIAAEEIGEAMSKNVVAYRELLAKTPVNHVEVQDRPVVLFRPNPNTWVEAIVRYLVDPKDAGAVKNSLTRKLLAALNAAPDKVMFPKSNAR